MNGSNSQMIAEIKTAITNGALSYAEMKRRLDDAIDVELTKTTGEADLELVKACQSLLCELHMHGTTPQDHTEQNLMGAKPGLHNRMRRHHFRRGILRAAVAAAAILLIAFAMEILLHKEWLGGVSTIDEQDYVVQSYVVDPNTVKSGTAAVDEEEDKYGISTDIGAVSSILRIKPLIPTWLPKGWELLQYEAMVIDGTEYFSAIYQNAGSEKLLRYEIHSAVGPAQNLYAEQNASGDQIQLSNGQTVYLSMNLELPTCAWIQNEMAFFISGPLLKDDILQMANSI